MNITSQIFQVGGSDESHPSDASIYLIVSKGEAALVDSGTGRGFKKVMKNLRKLGFSPDLIKYIFLTHCHFDHSGGAEKIRETTDCKIVIHELDAGYLEKGDNVITAASWYGASMNPLEIDIKVKDKEQSFNVGDILIKFYHTPGHSPGSSVLTAKSDGKLVLFGQDIHGPLNDLFFSNREDYEKSLEFMVSLEADIVCEGHFGVYFDKDIVRDFIESFL